jgi:hypothetical protein
MQRLYNQRLIAGMSCRAETPPAPREINHPKDVPKSAGNLVFPRRQR